MRPHGHVGRSRGCAQRVYALPLSAPGNGGLGPYSHAPFAQTAVGETEQRLYALAAWRETSFFSARERAALGFTETVTRLAETHVPDAAYEEVAAVYGPAEVAALLALILAINVWNTLGVTTRAWEPGSYEPRST